MKIKNSTKLMVHIISLPAKGYYGFIRLHKNFRDDMEYRG